MTSDEAADAPAGLRLGKLVARSKATRCLGAFHRLGVKEYGKKK